MFFCGNLRGGMAEKLGVLCFLSAGGGGGGGGGGNHSQVWCSSEGICGSQLQRNLMFLCFLSAGGGGIATKSGVLLVGI